jgi:DNA-directed RNA polymerase specialized sigma24 family protein
VATRELQTANITAALTRLTPEHREIIRLAHHHRMPVREIATLLDLSERTVRRRILFALQSLRLALIELGDGDATLRVPRPAPRDPEALTGSWSRA